MKAMKTSGRTHGVLLQGPGKASQYGEKVSVPGMGYVRVVSDNTFTSAKTAAASRLKVAIATTGEPKVIE